MMQTSLVITSSGAKEVRSRLASFEELLVIDMVVVVVGLKS